METKELKVGDYIRGFKYDCHEGLEYRMNSHIGQIAIIVERIRGLIKVEFEDNSTWYYPHNLAIEHLVDPLEETPFHKPDFSHLLDVDKILEKGIKNSGLNDKPIEELEEHFKDNINPSHYKNKPKETIERIKDNLTTEEFKGYLKGNILKYLDRYENKNGVEDLKKANWYLNKLIEIENGKA